MSTATSFGDGRRLALTFRAKPLSLGGVSGSLRKVAGRAGSEG
jgi:hypothetical protein